MESIEYNIESIEEMEDIKRQLEAKIDRKRCQAKSFDPTDRDVYIFLDNSNIW